MRFAASLLSIALLAVFGVIQGTPQEGPSASNDPRVGLKAGLRDAGTASRNLELVASIPKPAGFFDPKAPAGLPTPPERAPGEEAALDQAAREHEVAGTSPPPQPGADNL